MMKGIKISKFKIHGTRVHCFNASNCWAECSPLGGYNIA